jgi:S1-C subfamily serine protease
VAGDVITGVDGIEAADPRAVLYRLTTRGVGNRAKLDVLRRGRKMMADVALRSAPAPGRDDIRNLAGAHPFDGVRVSNLLPGVGEEFGIDDEEGVVVTMVKAGSTAASLGFRTGDIVVRVGRETIDTVLTLERALKERQRLWQVAVKRGGRLLTLEVQG